VKRGDIYDARLDPVEGSEQGGTRPVAIVSRDAINAYSPVVLAVPCTSYRENRRVYPTQVLVIAPDGGLSNDSIFMADQVRVMAKDRLLKFRGRLSNEAIDQLNQALIIALDLPN
jgi:mRNA interferase MazF